MKSRPRPDLPLELQPQPNDDEMHSMLYYMTGFPGEFAREFINAFREFGKGYPQPKEYHGCVSSRKPRAK